LNTDPTIHFAKGESKWRKRPIRFLRHAVNPTNGTSALFIPRYTLQLVPGNACPDPSVVIRDSTGAASILRPLFHGLDREQFLVACLDAKHAIIGVNVVSIGSLTVSIVHPREVYKPAILLNSAAIICRVRMRSCDRILP